VRADSSSASPFDAALNDLERAVASAEREELPPLLGRLEALKSTLTLRLFSSSTPGASPTGQDRLLDVKEAAERLRTSADFLYRRARRLPFTVHLGRQLRFSSRGIDTFIATRQGRGY
jgi:predicted DNA-binding transcriptional regulator AlpA